MELLDPVDLIHKAVASPLRGDMNPPQQPAEGVFEFRLK
jgi:hypothetical protein